MESKYPDNRIQPSGEDTLAAVYSKNATLEINAEVFEHAGVYHYVVTEDAGSYEGIDYDTASRDVYLLYITEQMEHFMLEM